MSVGTDPIIVIFSQEQICHRKVAHFLKRFGPDSHAELYGMPEVMKFYHYTS